MGAPTHLADERREFSQSETKQADGRRYQPQRRGSKRSSSQISATVPVHISVHGVQTDLTCAMMDRSDAEKVKEVEQLKQLVGELVAKLEAQGEGKAADAIAHSLGLHT